MLKFQYIGSVAEEMEERGIKEEDVISVVEHAESTSCKIQNSETGHYLAKHKIGNFTAYVEYTIDGEEVSVYNVHSHVVILKEYEEE